MIYFVFDVENVGLYGVPFAVAWVVVDDKGTRLTEGIFSCSMRAAMEGFAAEGRPGSFSPEDFSWAAQHVVPVIHQSISHENPLDMLKDFAVEWRKWKNRGAMMVSDCGYPVETGFLSRCVVSGALSADDAPYPLLDISSLLLGRGYDPKQGFSRLPEEMPAHNPLNDSRQSARVLLSLLKEVNE
jgi:hypothetical protein